MSLLNKIKEYEARLYERLDNEYEPWLTRIENGSWEKEDIEELKEILGKM